MPYLRGEDVNIGFGIESARGTPVAPGAWIPGRTPTGINVVIEKTRVRETRATKLSSQGSEIVKKAAGGNLEFNVRASSLGYLLKSLLGSVSSALKGGESAVYRHTFGVLANSPQHPSLTLGLSQPGIQDYEYPLALVKNLELRTPVDDLVNATIELVAQKEQEKSPAYSPAFAGNDYYFRHQDVVIKIADDLAGLDAASAIKVKDFSVSVENNARHNQNVSELNPGDVIASDFEIEGQIDIDYQAKTYHDLFTAGTYKAFRIEMIRSDITIGTGSNPKIHLDLPKISFEGVDPNRPIDDIVMQSLKFVAHYSLTDALGIRLIIDNEKANYNS